MCCPTTNGITAGVQLVDIAPCPTADHAAATINLGVQPVNLAVRPTANRVATSIKLVEIAPSPTADGVTAGVQLVYITPGPTTHGVPASVKLVDVTPSPTAKAPSVDLHSIIGRVVVRVYTRQSAYNNGVFSYIIRMTTAVVYRPIRV